MIQGGDPTGTGKGGQSIWGKPFPDEIRQTLRVREALRTTSILRCYWKFNNRGVVAMANAGPDTNKSQVSERLWIKVDKCLTRAVLHHIRQAAFTRWQVLHLWPASRP